MSLFLLSPTTLFYLYVIIALLSAVPALHCCEGFSLGVGSRGYSLVAEFGVASPAAERRLFCPRLQGLPLPGSWAQAQQLRQVGRAALQHAGPSRSRDRTRLSAWAGRFFTTEPPRKPLPPLSKDTTSFPGL